MSSYTVCVAGNPNSGKTSLFNTMAGVKQKVGNWPGVTVERKTAITEFNGNSYEMVDLPGIYSLNADSLDEQVAKDYLCSKKADLIINIIDATNIERNLYLTVELLEMGLPVVVALNMMDLAKNRRIQIDIKKLSQRLACPVVPIVASKGEGIEQLKSVMERELNSKHDTSPQQVRVAYQSIVNESASELETVLKNSGVQDASYYQALSLLESGDTASFSNEVQEQTVKLRDKIKETTGEDVEVIFAEGRYSAISDIVANSIQRGTAVGKNITDMIDAVVLNRFLGIPIFFLAMYVMFIITINLGDVFIDFFDIFFGALFVDGLANLLTSWSFPEWLVTLLSSGLGGGIQTISTFIPQIGLMFICLCFLEDSGYMARAAFVMDRFMRLIGLPGKSFIPMLVGFGCNVPAIMATRTLESQRDRTLTIMMNPFMSCGARLPVYVMFVAVFFPTHGQNLVFGLYLVGVIVAIISGFILKHTLLRGENSIFIMELPQYHIPTIRSVVLAAWERLKGFIFRAGSVIIPVMMVLGFLNSIGTDGSFNNDNSDKSVLSVVAKTATPAFHPMGITDDNWPATLGIFTGIFAKESVVGTLDAIYTQLASKESEEEADEAEDFSLSAKFKEALNTIPEKLAGLVNALADPLGFHSTEDETSLETHSVIVSLFDGEAGVIAYLLFILLYAPCVASIATIYRELNLFWAIFATCWTTAIAYIVSTMFYQIATYSSHPQSSLNWIVLISVICVLGIFVMKIVGKGCACYQMLSGLNNGGSAEGGCRLCRACGCVPRKK